MSKITLKILQLRMILLSLTMGLIGCSNITNLVNSSSATNFSNELNNLPKVVATTSVLCDLTKQVAAQTINLTCLIPRNVDPQLYQPTPEDRQAIEEATVILFNGHNFEPNLFPLIRESKNPIAKIAVTQRAVPKPLIIKENGRNVVIPQVWHNAKNGIKMVEVINTNLTKILPENASLYNSNTQAITEELTKLDVWMKARVASVPPKYRALVTTHQGMAYFAQAYGLAFRDTLTRVRTNQEPNPTRIKTLARDIKQVKARTIFHETTTNPNLINTVATQANVQVSGRHLLIDNLGEPGEYGDTYQKMLAANTRTIVEGLGGTYLIFDPHVIKK